jgi:predicted DNA-binding ribbon-helix-helix protein
MAPQHNVSRMRKRSIHLRGQKTSVSLEDEFWIAFHEIALARNERVVDLINAIDRERPSGVNLSSAIRLFVLRYFKAQI